MKTHDELIEAIRCVNKEANESGFTFCAAIAPSDANPVTTFFCGESLKLVGLAGVIKLNIFEKNKFTDI
jgi:hypothetical protein